MLPSESLTFRMRAGKRVFGKHLAVAVKQLNVSLIRGDP